MVLSYVAGQLRPVNIEAIGQPILRWLDEEVLPIAAQLIESTHQYVRAWRALWQ